MTHLGHDFDFVQIAEVITQPIRPLVPQHAIFFSPEYARWKGALRYVEWSFPHRFQTKLIGRCVPIEAALHVARFHEVVDPDVQILVEGTLSVAVVIERVAEVYFGVLPIPR